MQFRRSHRSQFHDLGEVVTVPTGADMHGQVSRERPWPTNRLII